MSAKLQSNAANKAAKTQVAAGDRALAAQTAGYQQARTDFAPYQQQGVGAVGRLGQMAQAPRQTFDPRQQQGQPSPPPMQMASLGNPQGMPPQMPPQGPQQPLGGPQAPPRGMMGRIQDMARGAQQGMQGPPQVAPPGQMPPPQMGTQMPPAGGQMVRVRAPNGQEASLSADQAQQAVAKGAQIIG